MKQNIADFRFDQVPQVSYPRTRFDRSHRHVTTILVDKLVPVLCDKVMPGDTFDCHAQVFTRMLSPLKTPIMDNMYVDIHYFYVPARLIWENFDKFMGVRRPNPDSSIDKTIPTCNSGAGFATGSLADYLGLPTLVADIDVNVLPFRGYWAITNEWYLNKDTDDYIDFSIADGPDAITHTDVLTTRRKRHDMFTSCLTEPQEGDPVEINVGGIAEVWGSGMSLSMTDGSNTFGPASYEGLVGGSTWSKYTDAYDVLAGQAVSTHDVTYGKALGVVTSTASGTPPLYADLSTADAISINDLREAAIMQQFLERTKQAGTRYNDIIHAQFGVTCPDYRAQRPEFLGYQSFPLYANPVVQTSESGTTKQGTLTAHVNGGTDNGGFSKSFVEPGYVYGIMSVRADLTYQNGMDEDWFATDRFDWFMWPAFAHLGEQPVYKRQLFCDGSATDDQIFGYRPVYEEWRWKRNYITGDMRHNSTNGTLDSWHLSQNFVSHPTLNTTFIKADTPIERVRAVTQGPDFLVDVWFNYYCTRELPTYGTPGITRL